MNIHKLKKMRLWQPTQQDNTAMQEKREKASRLRELINRARKETGLIDHEDLPKPEETQPEQENIEN